MLRIDGLAKHTDDVMKMNNTILDRSDRYDLRPQGIEPSPTGSHFPFQFRVEAQLRDETPTNEEAH